MQYGNSWTYQIFNRNDRQTLIPLKNNSKATLQAIAITAVDRTGNESEKVVGKW
jgi:hypothetical protein